MKALCWCLLVIGGYLGLMIDPAYAQYQPLDHIVAVVNKEAITASQLQANLARIKRTAKSALPPEAELSNNVLNHMILERIQLQLASHAGIRVSEQELNGAIVDIAKRNGMTLVQFRQRLKTQGESYLEMRNTIRKEIIISRLQNASIAKNINITDQQVDNYLNTQEGKQQLEVHYRLGHIFLSVPESAPPSQWALKEDAAKKLTHRLIQRASMPYFMQQARQLSDDKRIDMGWRTKDELPTDFTNTLINMHPGEIVGPLKSANGFHIVALLDVKSAQQKVLQQQIKVRHILITPSVTLSERGAIRRANSIWRELKAQDLKNFAKLAKKYSDDPGSKFQGGELGWTNLQQLDKTFRENVENAPKNTLIRPFHSQFGWHIAEVQGHRTIDVSNEQLRQRIRQWLFERSYKVQLQSWLHNIRKEAYVEIRQ